MLPGADVSKHQGSIDWDAFAPLLDFVFVRATQGISIVDPQFSRNRAEAARRGVIRGYYHFANPAGDAVLQGRLFCDQIGALGPGELDPVLDLETTHLGRAPDNWTPADTAHLCLWTLAFRETIEARFPGRSIILYAPASFWARFMGGTRDFVDCPLWVAHYTRGSSAARARPPDDPRAWPDWAAAKPLTSWAPWPAWIFWQFTSQARMAGVPDATVDANLFSGTAAELHALAHLDANQTGENETLNRPGAEVK